MTRELAIDQLFNKDMHGHDFEVTTSDMVPAYTEAANLFHPLFVHVLPNPPETTVYMVGSSTEKDLHGDTMELSALQDMCDVAPNMSLFMNHDYTLPDSLYGSLLTRPIMQRGNDVVDLYIAGDTEISNEAAMKTYGYIRKGRRIGVSGGFRVLDYVVDGDEDDWFAPLKITHVQAVEFSTVGIPANQRSWVENAAYGIFVRGILEDRGDDVLRLAPIVKGLFPRGYRDVVRSLESQGLRKELERRPARPQHPSKLLWDGTRRTFVMSYRGTGQDIDRGQIGPFIQAGINAMRQLSPYQHLNPTVQPEEEDLSLEGVCGTTSGSLADKGTSWSGSKARKQIFAYADGSVSKAKTCFMYYGGSGSELTQGDFKLPFKYVDGGTPKIVFNGAKAIANVLMGGRGGVKGLSESERNSVKRKVSTIYHRFSETPPWEKESDDGKDFDPERDLDWEGIEDVDIEDIEGLEIKADGTHAPTKGNHKHSHASYGQKADSHNHDHGHDNDNNHDHHGADGDGDEDDGTQDTKALAIDDDGNHADFDGDHSHHHRSYGQKADGSQHTHKHSHSNDSNHKHSHTDQNSMGNLHICASTDCCPEMTDTDSLSLSFEPGNPLHQAKLSMVNTLLAELGLPTYRTGADGIPLLTNAAAVHEHLRRAGAQLHDIATSLHPKVCPGMQDGGDDGDGNNAQMNGNGAVSLAGGTQTVPEAEAEAQRERETLLGLRKDLGQVVKALQGLDGLNVKALTDQVVTIQANAKKAQASLSAIEQQVADLQNRPMGRPTNLNTSTVPDGSMIPPATYQDMLSAGRNAQPTLPLPGQLSLREALALTRQVSVDSREPITGHVSKALYREWPDGLIPDGGRPPLSGDEMSLMRPSDIMAYQAGNQAIVPIIGDTMDELDNTLPSMLH